MFRKLTVAALGAAIVALGSASTATALAPPSSGDPVLLELAQPILERSVQRSVSVAVVDRSGIRVANFGAANDTEYEIGSLTKTFTAELFVDSVRRGEVREDSTLEEFLPLGGTPVGGVTLIDLAGHRSGLPPFALTADMAGHAFAWVVAQNPFEFDTEQLLQQARQTPLLTPGQYQYSTFGYALLGQALAAAADTDYSTLLTERMLEPMGLDDTWVPLSAANLPADATTGYDVLGRTQAAWPLDAYAPAGGVRSTIMDMGEYAEQLLDGAMPGVSAMDPRWTLANSTHSALSWVVSNHPGGEYTVHSGSTGGFQSIMVLDRERHRAVVVLSNTLGSLSDAALAIMAHQ